jgi:hypothetical protein
MSIELDPSVPFVNSSRFNSDCIPYMACKNTKVGYALDPNDPGVKVHEAVLLAAFIAGKKVRLLINQCVFDKPRDRRGDHWLREQWRCLRLAPWRALRSAWR